MERPIERRVSMDGGVPPCASFFEVADPSMEATHMEPSLALPKAFIKRFHSYLSHSIVLEGPSGKMWKSHLEFDTQKQLRITEGWKDLAHYLDIQSGDLLVLDLVCKGHFRVYIYEGEDMCEKDLYVTKSPESCINGMHVASQESCDQDMHVMSATEFMTGVKRRKGEGMHTCTSHKISHTDKYVQPVLDNTHTCESLKDLDVKEANALQVSKTKHARRVTHDSLNIIPHHSPNSIKRRTKPHLTVKDLHEFCHNLHVQTQQAFNMALSYSSEGPFIVMMMVHSSVCHGYKVGIPRAFAEQHMSAEREHVVLIDITNRAWSVTWLGHTNECPAFSGGWRHFAEDHHLECGDICIFERTSTKPVSTFKVHIFKVHYLDRQELQQKVPRVIGCTPT